MMNFSQMREESRQRVASLEARVRGVEAFTSIVNHPDFKSFKKWMEAKVNDNVGKALSTDDHAEIYRCQGRVDAYDGIMELAKGVGSELHRLKEELAKARAYDQEINSRR